MHGFHFKFNKIANRLAALSPAISRPYPATFANEKFIFPLKFASDSIKITGKSVYVYKTFYMQSNCHFRANHNGVLCQLNKIYKMTLCSKYENE